MQKQRTNSNGTDNNHNNNNINEDLLVYPQQEQQQNSYSNNYGVTALLSGNIPNTQLKHQHQHHHHDHQSQLQHPKMLFDPISGSVIDSASGFAFYSNNNISSNPDQTRSHLAMMAGSNNIVGNEKSTNSNINTNHNNNNNEASLNTYHNHIMLMHHEKSLSNNNNNMINNNNNIEVSMISSSSPAGGGGAATSANADAVRYANYSNLAFRGSSFQSLQPREYQSVMSSPLNNHNVSGIGSTRRRKSSSSQYYSLQQQQSSQHQQGETRASPSPGFPAYPVDGNNNDVLLAPKLLLRRAQKGHNNTASTGSNILDDNNRKNQYYSGSTGEENEDDDEEEDEETDDKEFLQHHHNQYHNGNNDDDNALLREKQFDKNYKRQLHFSTASTIRRSANAVISNVVANLRKINADYETEAVAQHREKIAQHRHAIAARQSKEQSSQNKKSKVITMLDSMKRQKQRASKKHDNQNNNNRNQKLEVDEDFSMFDRHLRGADYGGEFEPIVQVGHGSYGQIYIVLWHPPQQQLEQEKYAAKKIKLEETRRKNKSLREELREAKRRAKEEAKLIPRSRHHNSEAKQEDISSNANDESDANTEETEILCKMRFGRVTAGTVDRIMNGDEEPALSNLNAKSMNNNDNSNDNDGADNNNNTNNEANITSAMVVSGDNVGKQQLNRKGMADKKSSPSQHDQRRRKSVANGEKDEVASSTAPKKRPIGTSSARRVRSENNNNNNNDDDGSGALRRPSACPLPASRHRRHRRRLSTSSVRSTSAPKNPDRVVRPPISRSVSHMGSQLDVIAVEGGSLAKQRHRLLAQVRRRNNEAPREKNNADKILDRNHLPPVSAGRAESGNKSGTRSPGVTSSAEARRGRFSQYDASNINNNKNDNDAGSLNQGASMGGLPLAATTSGNPNNNFNNHMASATTSAVLARMRRESLPSAPLSGIGTEFMISSPGNQRFSQIQQQQQMSYSAHQYQSPISPHLSQQQQQQQQSALPPFHSPVSNGVIEANGTVKSGQIRRPKHVMVMDSSNTNPNNNNNNIQNNNNNNYPSSGSASPKSFRIENSPSETAPRISNGQHTTKLHYSGSTSLGTNKNNNNNNNNDDCKGLPPRHQQPVDDEEEARRFFEEDEDFEEDEEEDADAEEEDDEEQDQLDDDKPGEGFFHHHDSSEPPVRLLRAGPVGGGGAVAAASTSCINAKVNINGTEYDRDRLLVLKVEKLSSFTQTWRKQILKIRQHVGMINEIDLNETSVETAKQQKNQNEKQNTNGMNCSSAPSAGATNGPQQQGLSSKHPETYLPHQLHPLSDFQLQGDLPVLHDTRLVSAIAAEKNFRMRQEASLLSTVAHPNIIGYVDSFFRAGSQMTLLEYVEGGDVEKEFERARMKATSVFRPVPEYVDAALVEVAQEHFENVAKTTSTVLPDEFLSTEHDTNNNGENFATSSKHQRQQQQQHNKNHKTVAAGLLQSHLQQQHHQRRNHVLSEDIAMLVFVQAIMAVEYIHRHNILHRDIKVANLMISRGSFLVKLIDFGTSQQYDTDVSRPVAGGLRGSPLSICPEVWLGLPYTEKADMFSLGVVLYQLLEETYPWHPQHQRRAREQAEAAEAALLLQMQMQSPASRGASVGSRRPSTQQQQQQQEQEKKKGNSTEEIKALILSERPRPMKRQIARDVLQLTACLLSRDPANRPTALQCLRDFPSMRRAADSYLRMFRNIVSTRPSSVITAADRKWLGVLQDHYCEIYEPNLLARTRIVQNLQGLKALMYLMKKKVEDDASKIREYEKEIAIAKKNRKNKTLSNFATWSHYRSHQEQQHQHGDSNNSYSNNNNNTNNNKHNSNDNCNTNLQVAAAADGVGAASLKNDTTTNDALPNGCSSEDEDSISPTTAIVPRSTRIEGASSDQNHDNTTNYMNTKSNILSNNPTHTQSTTNLAVPSVVAMNTASNIYSGENDNATATAMLLTATATAANKTQSLENVKRTGESYATTDDTLITQGDSHRRTDEEKRLRDYYCYQNSSSGKRQQQQEEGEQKQQQEAGDEKEQESFNKIQQKKLHLQQLLISLRSAATAANANDSNSNKNRNNNLALALRKIAKRYIEEEEKETKNMKIKDTQRHNDDDGEDRSSATRTNNPAAATTATNPPTPTITKTPAPFSHQQQQQQQTTTTTTTTTETITNGQTTSENNNKISNINHLNDKDTKSNSDASHEGELGVVVDGHIVKDDDPNKPNNTLGSFTSGASPYPLHHNAAVVVVSRVNNNNKNIFGNDQDKNNNNNDTSQQNQNQDGNNNYNPFELSAPFLDLQLRTVISSQQLREESYEARQLLLDSEKVLISMIQQLMEDIADVV